MDKDGGVGSGGASHVFRLLYLDTSVRRPQMLLPRMKRILIMATQSLRWMVEAIAGIGWTTVEGDA